VTDQAVHLSTITDSSYAHGTKNSGLRNLLEKGNYSASKLEVTGLHQQE